VLGGNGYPFGAQSLRKAPYALIRNASQMASTVGTHLRSACRKVGAGSRRETIARGRLLGVL